MVLGPTHTSSASASAQFFKKLPSVNKTMEDLSRCMPVPALPTGDIPDRKSEFDSIIAELSADSWSHYESDGVGKHHASIYLGYLGTCGYVRYRLARSLSWTKSDRERAEKLKLLRCASEAVQRVLASYPARRGMRITFLEGERVGALALYAVINHSLEGAGGKLYDYEFWSEKALRAKNELLDVGRDFVHRSLFLSECELFYGRAGYLQAIEFIRSETGDKEFGDALVRPILKDILSEGERVAGSRNTDFPLLWEWPDGEVDYLGIAHGVAGILLVLLSFYKEITAIKDAPQKIKMTISALNKACHASGNLKPGFRDSTDRLVHVCHGAPGHILLLVKAYEVLNEISYLERAEKLGRNIVCRRGLLKKGVGLCHGISGNAYCFLELDRGRRLAIQRSSEAWDLRSIEWLQWAHHFAKFAVDNLGSLFSVPDRPYSLWEGISGLIMLLHDLKDPNVSSCFPCFESEDTAVTTESASEKHSVVQSIAEEPVLDTLEQLVNQAAERRQSVVQFAPSTSGGVLPNTTIELPEPENPSDLTLFSDKVKEFNEVRLSLISIMERKIREPVQLPSKYIEKIKTKEILGGGYFGKVCLGVDGAIGKRFAIKLINSLVIEESLSKRLESIQKTFRNEIKVLSQINHPNISALYGFCMDENSLENVCLLYELAVNASLDKFWASRDDNNEMGRQRLSNAKTRAKIALEVATVLRYMHEGLDGGDICFHRDIKSANICLMADFSVRVIDCGLSKYVTEQPGSFSITGATGTPGYTCPQYFNGEVSFCSACDVFSLGVLLCELITGKTTSRHSQHYPCYKLIKRRRLEEDADEFVDWEREGHLDLLVKLALECLEYETTSRPSIGHLVEQLRDSLSISEPELGSKDNNYNISRVRCRVCGEIKEKCITCFGSQRHIHCHNCFEGQMMRNVNSFKYDGVACPKGGCDSRPFKDEEIAGFISQNVWNSYLMQRNSELIQRLFVSAKTSIDERIQEVQDLQVKLCAGNGLPCPKLFLLMEADRNVKIWHNPREWAKNARGVKLYLYFVCSHSLRPVSDRCRIKVRYTHDWVKAVAPALNSSLDFIKIALNISIGRDSPLEFAKIQAMDEWCKGLLGTEYKSAIEEANNRGGGSDESIQTLVGNSLSHVAEKAASSNINWQSELVPVFDFEKREPTFVLSEFASERRYQREVKTQASGMSSVSQDILC